MQFIVKKDLPMKVEPTGRMTIIGTPSEFKRDNIIYAEVRLWGNKSLNQLSESTPSMLRHRIVTFGRSLKNCNSDASRSLVESGIDLKRWKLEKSSVS